MDKPETASWVEQEAFERKEEERSLDIHSRALLDGRRSEELVRLTRLLLHEQLKTNLVLYATEIQ